MFLVTKSLKVLVADPHVHRHTNTDTQLCRSPSPALLWWKLQWVHISPAEYVVPLEFAFVYMRKFCYYC